MGAGTGPVRYAARQLNGEWFAVRIAANDPDGDENALASAAVGVTAELLRRAAASVDEWEHDNEANVLHSITIDSSDDSLSLTLIFCR